MAAGRYFSLVILVVFSSLAFAKSPILDLFVNESLIVLSEPKTGAKEITRLVPGDQVVISPKTYGKFRKVLVTYEGQSRGGFVLVADLKKSQILPREELDAEQQPIYRKKYELGGNLIFSMLQQGSSTFQMSDNTVYAVTELKSNSFYLAGFFDWDWGKHWSTRFSLSLRNTQFRGTADQQNASVPSPRAVERDQSFLGLGITLKRYTTDESKWWWGFGGEAAMGTKVTVKISGTIVPTQDDMKPFFGIGYGAMGAEIPLLNSKNWFMVTDLKVGVIATTAPMTLMEEVNLGLAHQL